VFADIRLDVEERSRDELSLPDFVLCAEFTRLLSILNEIANGEIPKIEIRGGVKGQLTLLRNRGSYLPAPVRLTVCGLFAAESVNVSLPVMVPFTAGVNVMLTVQLAPPPMPEPQVFAVIA